MRFSFIWAFLLLLTFRSFGQEKGFFINDTLVQSKNPNCWTLSTKFQPKEFKNFDLGMREAKIIDNHLVLYIVYGGGCGMAKMRLYVDSPLDFIRESVIRLFPEFIKNDPCEGLRYQEICFDLSPLIGQGKSLVLSEVRNSELTIQVK